MAVHMSDSGWVEEGMRCLSRHRTKGSPSVARWSREKGRKMLEVGVAK